MREALRTYALPVLVLGLVLALLSLLLVSGALDTFVRERPDEPPATTMPTVEILL